MSPDATVSPSFTSHLASVPSSIVGDKAGILSSIDMVTLGCMESRGTNAKAAGGVKWQTE
jgi:hypothetical protein